MNITEYSFPTEYSVEHNYSAEYTTIRPNIRWCASTCGGRLPTLSTRFQLISLRGCRSRLRAPEKSYLMLWAVFYAKYSCVFPYAVLRKALFATRKLPPLEWQISLVLPCTLFATLHSYHPCHPLSGRLVLSFPVHYLPPLRKPLYRLKGRRPPQLIDWILSSCRHISYRISQHEILSLTFIFQKTHHSQ